MDYKNIFSDKLNKAKSGLHIQGVWLTLVVMSAFTTACREAVSPPETAVIISPLSSPELVISDTPTPIPEKKETVMPLPTRPPVKTTPVSPTDVDFIEEIDPLIREQLSQTNGGYFILQFNDLSIDQDTQSKLSASNIRLFDPVAEFGYYAYLPSESLSTIEELLQNGVLERIDLIPDGDKWRDELQEDVQTDQQQRVELIVQFFEEPSLTDQEKLEELLDVSAYSFGPVNFAEGTAAANDVEKILSLPFVKLVEDQPVNELFVE